MAFTVGGARGVFWLRTGGGFVSVAHAPNSDFPAAKPIEMTVMFGAGSAADVTARYLADGMAKTLGVPVPVVNRTGRGGAIGYSHVKQQRPDGHAIISDSNSISSTYPYRILPLHYTAFHARS